MSYNYRITTFIELEHKIKVFLEETTLESKISFVIFIVVSGSQIKTTFLFNIYLQLPYYTRRSSPYSKLNLENPFL